MNEKIICPDCKKDLSLAARILGTMDALEIHGRAHQRQDLCETLKRIRKGFDDKTLQALAVKELDNLINVLDY